MPGQLSCSETGGKACVGLACDGRLDKAGGLRVSFHGAAGWAGGRKKRTSSAKAAMQGGTALNEGRYIP